MTGFQRVERPQYHSIVVQQVRALVDRGALHAGERLPSERELANSLGISRATLREALRELEVIGLVESRLGQGRFISAPSPTHKTDGSTPSHQVEESTILDLMEARRPIEGEIAALAAQRASVEDIAHLERSLNLRVWDERSGITGDTAFHLALAEASHNSVLKRIITGELLLISNANRQYGNRPERVADMDREHLAILEQVRLRNPGGARYAMLEHLAAAERFIRTVSAVPTIE